jgi:hypothetical protein
MNMSEIEDEVDTQSSASSGFVLDSALSRKSFRSKIFKKVNKVEV